MHSIGRVTQLEEPLLHSKVPGSALTSDATCMESVHFPCGHVDFLEVPPHLWVGQLLDHYKCSLVGYWTTLAVDGWQNVQGC